ncbi:MAG: hypothetical protein PHV68_08450 [Candidatus Gastranaerophilales bacterium]|nr:hypothetical protein [Candidatus Gastranaerophilales bacterium]
MSGKKGNIFKSIQNAKSFRSRASPTEHQSFPTMDNYRPYGRKQGFPNRAPIIPDNEQLSPIRAEAGLPQQFN